MRLIDADDAIKEIKHGLESLWYASDIKRYEEGVEFAISRLEDMETIDAEPVKHGKWEVGCAGKIRICSSCKESFDDTCNFIERDWHYCPNCGADMRGDHE